MNGWTELVYFLMRAFSFSRSLYCSRDGSHLGDCLGLVGVNHSGRHRVVLDPPKAGRLDARQDDDYDNMAAFYDSNQVDSTRSKVPG